MAENKTEEPKKENIDESSLTPEQKIKWRHAVGEFSKKMNYLEDKYKLALYAVPIPIMSKDNMTVAVKAKVVILPTKEFFKEKKIIEVGGLVKAKKITPHKFIR